MKPLIVILGLVVLCLAIDDNLFYWVVTGVIIAGLFEIFSNAKSFRKIKPSWEIVRAGVFLGLVGWAIDLFTTSLVNFFW